MKESMRSLKCMQAVGMNATSRASVVGKKRKSRPKMRSGRGLGVRVGRAKEGGAGL
jgi:hypothetical protein